MATSTLENRNILIAIDDSTATWTALDYVADLARTKQDLCIHLLHATVYPPVLQESRGAENPYEEERVEKDLERKQERWEQGIQSAAAPIFDKDASRSEESRCAAAADSIPHRRVGPSRGFDRRDPEISPSTGLPHDRRRPQLFSLVQRSVCRSPRRRDFPEGGGHCRQDN